MVNGKRWTDKEIQFLRNNYEEMIDKELGEALERTVPSIRGMRYQLNLIKKVNRGQFEKIPMPPKNELKKLYLEEDKTPSRIAQVFHVSSNTVRRWLHRYNISIKRPYLSKVTLEIPELEKAYLAGLVDGDGTITANKYKNKRNRTGYGFQKDVAIISTHREFIERLHKMIGGDIQTFIYHDSRERKEGYKLGFCNQRSALSFLNAVSPYLILKKEQAETMKTLLESRLSARSEKGPSAPISPQEWDLVDEIRRLNQYE